MRRRVGGRDEKHSCGTLELRHADVEGSCESEHPCRQ